MASHPAALDPIVIPLAIAIGVVIFYYLIRWIRHTLGHLGLSPGEIAVIIWATLVGSLINIPLTPFGEGFLGINVGGAIVPIVLSAYLIRRKGLPINEVLVGIVLVALVSYLVTNYDPEIGVYAELPWWLLPPFAAFLVAAFAYWHERPHSAALAYVSGTLGTLLGADIVRLPQILSGPPPEAGGILSIGGAGVFDMVFLAGILAVTMETALLARTREDLVSQRGHNPIDAEYEAWVRQKEKESEQNRAKYRQLQRRRKKRDEPTTTRQPDQWDRLPIERGATGAEAGSRTRPRETVSGSRPSGRSRYQPRYRRTDTYTSRYRSRRTRRFTRASYESRTQKRLMDRRASKTARHEGEAQERLARRERRDDEARARGRQQGRGAQERPVERRAAGPDPSQRKDRDDRGAPAREGPRPPPRQPRPASGTKRIPASHRARGLYK